MQYARFERLVIAITALIVLGSLALSLVNGGAEWVEVVAQFVIIVVVAVAVHWGRKAGTIVALAASVVYLLMRIPLLSAGLAPDDVLLVVSRIAVYMLLGIVGGEVVPVTAASMTRAACLSGAGCAPG